MTRKADPVVLEYQGRIYTFEHIEKNTWQLTANIEITLSERYHGGAIITIPMGFLTDFRSGPAIINPFVPKYGLWYVIHDWLYRHQYSTRTLANKEQDYWMRYYAVKPFVRGLINKGVELFGQKYWNYYGLGGAFPFSWKKYRELKKVRS